jgi:hypothetical protein
VAGADGGPAEILRKHVLKAGGLRSSKPDKPRQLRPLPKILLLQKTRMSSSRYIKMQIITTKTQNKVKKGKFNDLRPNT